MAQKIGANIIVRFVNALQKRSREEQHLNTFGEEDDLVRARADPVDLIVSALDEGDESYQNADQSSQLAFIAVPMKTRFERTRREMAAAASQTRCEVPTATQPSTKKPRAIRQYILEPSKQRGFIPIKRKSRGDLEACHHDIGQLFHYWEAKIWEIQEKEKCGNGRHYYETLARRQRGRGSRGEKYRE